MESDIDKIVEKAMHNRAVWVDSLIAAYLRENGCKASEIELVEQRHDDRLTWHVRKRTVQGEGKDE